MVSNGQEIPVQKKNSMYYGSIVVFSTIWNTQQKSASKLSNI